jgi:hypothetical protein
MRRQQEQQYAQRKAAAAAAGLFQPVPGSIQQALVSNQEGADISDAFAPQMQQGPARRRTPEEIAAGLAGLTAGAPGFNPTPYRELAAFAKPNLMITPTGEAIDQYDPSNAGRVFPGLEKGQVLSRAGVTTLPGYAQSLGEIEGAKTGAQEGAKAQLDVIQLPMPDGSTQAIPRDVAVKLILQSMAGGQGSGEASGGVGRSQTPADKVRAEGGARTEVERAAAQPQAFAGLQDQARVSSQARGIIHELLGDTYDPKTKTWSQGGSVSPIGGIGDALSGGWTAGLGANLAPIAGTKSYDLKSRLDTLNAITAVEELQKMRANSPTGGALGSVSDRENAMLSALRGSLAQGQGAPQLKRQLRDYLTQLDQIAEERAKLYRNTYTDTQAGSPRTTGRNGSRIISVQ